MEFSKIKEVNEKLKPFVIERKDKKTGKITTKDYNTVDQRILGFRELFPNGSIQTEILKFEGEVVLMKATVYDDNGKVISTGHAMEKESSSYINQTSFVENCETSCIGRALGIIGIGIIDDVASAEEVANVIDAENKRDNEALEGITNELKDLYNKAGGKDFDKWVKSCGGISDATYMSMKATLLKQINNKEEKKA